MTTNKIKLEVTKVEATTDLGTKTVYINSYKNLSDAMLSLTGRAFDNNRCSMFEYKSGVDVTLRYVPKNSNVWYMLVLSEC